MEVSGKLQAPSSVKNTLQYYRPLLPAKPIVTR